MASAEQHKVQPDVSHDKRNTNPQPQVSGPKWLEVYKKEDIWVELWCCSGTNWLPSLQSLHFDFAYSHFSSLLIPFSHSGGCQQVVLSYPNMHCIAFSPLRLTLSLSSFSRISIKPRCSFPPKWSARRRSLSWRPRYAEHTSHTRSFCCWKLDAGIEFLYTS